MSLATIRRTYSRARLQPADLAADPLTQFTRWFAQARRARQPEPNAMALATATRAGRPSVRMVLLKGFDRQGLVFYTNTASRKARELAGNPKAAAVFHWGALERNVRIEGIVKPVSRREAQRYFASRPRAHQLGAWASAQSRVIASRAVLERRLREAAARYRGRAVPLPPFWGGFRLIPSAAEFWKGRPGQLHDRLRYVRRGTRWKIERLAP